MSGELRRTEAITHQVRKDEFGDILFRGVVEFGLESCDELEELDDVEKCLGGERGLEKFLVRDFLVDDMFPDGLVDFVIGGALQAHNGKAEIERSLDAGLLAGEGGEAL